MATPEQKYRERSRNFLVKAREELASGDLEQASEKGWGAAAVVVKALAEKRGDRHTGHALLSNIVDILARETGDPELSAMFDVASRLHINFYEHTLDAQGIADRIDVVERFVEKIDALL